LVMAGGRRAGLDARRDIGCDSAAELVEGDLRTGDICCVEAGFNGRPVRVEHWERAMQQGHHEPRRG